MNQSSLSSQTENPSINNDNNNINISSIECTNCSIECKPLRCSACKLVSYCSKTCQRLHWKKHHKHVCCGMDNNKRKKKETKKVKDESRNVFQAGNELQMLISNMSSHEMKQHYDKTMDHLEYMKISSPSSSLSINSSSKQQHQKLEEEKAEREQKQLEENIQPASSNIKKKLNSSSSSVATCIPDAKINDIALASNGSNEYDTIETSYNNSNCSYTVEKLVYTCTYAVTIVIDPTEHTLPKKRENIKIQIMYDHQEKFSRKLKSHVKVQLNTNQNYNSAEKESKTITLLSIHLPDQIFSTEEDVLSSLTIHDDDESSIHIYITFKLQYKSKDQDYFYDDLHLSSSLSSTKLTNPDDLNGVQCRCCHQYLLTQQQHRPDSTTSSESNNENTDSKIEESYIQQVYHLPNGYWDEITDYLTCYEGQATINFSSSANTIERGIAYEDGSILVMNKKDLHNVCILAIEGYGESGNEDIYNSITKSASNSSGTIQDEKGTDLDEINSSVMYRGKRTWQDKVGGATVCCAQCCSILGYASLEEPDTCRLLKHRLRAITTTSQKNNGNTMKVMDCFYYNTCESFIGRELLRYAESQAVFNFVIFQDTNPIYDVSAAGKISDKRKGRRCLVLKLLSWNTFMNINLYHTSERQSSGSNRGKCFRRIAKVIFEETDDLDDALDDNGNENDPMNFTWGNFDPCCPPENSQNLKLATKHTTRKDDTSKNEGTNEENNDLSKIQKASVQMHLSSDEWTGLRDVLEAGRSLIPESISKATVLCKLGVNDGVEKRKAYLSMLQLPLLE